MGDGCAQAGGSLWMTELLGNGVRPADLAT
jgi:hypothetical protein